MSKTKMAPAAAADGSATKLTGNAEDLDKITINTVTTKTEFRGLLRRQGVLALFASILRGLYEGEESEWPKNVQEFLLRRFVNEISIVKQMRLMNTNFTKRTRELETLGKEKLARRQTKTDRTKAGHAEPPTSP